MAQIPVYCEVQCPTCPLRELQECNETGREYIARNMANVFKYFGASKIIKADRQARFVHDGSSIGELRWQAQILNDEDYVQLDLDDGQKVDEAILKIATGGCEHYFAERR